MKQSEIKALGLEEMTVQETMSTDGGAFPIGPILDWIMRFGSGFLVGFLAAKCADERKEVEEVDEYYGGELDAALCIG